METDGATVPGQRHPIPSGGGGGGEGASPPRQPILAGAAARCGFENSKGEAGNAEPQRVLGAGGEASGRGRDPDGDPRAAAGAGWEAFPQLIPFLANWDQFHH